MAELVQLGEEPGLDRLLMKLRARDLIDQDEENALRGSPAELKELRANRILVRAGVMVGACTLLLEGFVCRYRDHSDGQRQIMELHVPGDFLDLHSFLLKRLDHNVGSMTPVRYALVPHERIREISEQYPHLTRMFWFLTLVDAAIHRERIMSIGRRTAVARIAHLLCEMNVRLGIVGLAKGNRYRLPITQSDLADATGLTSVHVNRMLKKLRDEELMTFRGGEVTIHDWERLQRVADFDPTYLYLERMPR